MGLHFTVLIIQYACFPHISTMLLYISTKLVLWSPGICHVKELARIFIWWLGLDDDTQKRIQACIQCQINQKLPISWSLHPWEQHERPWSRVHKDYVGPIRNCYLLVLVDSYSDVVVVPSPNSSNTIQSLCTIFWTRGLPEEIMSDKGALFVSAEFKEFCSKWNAPYHNSSIYHPRCNG